MGKIKIAGLLFLLTGVASGSYQQQQYSPGPPFSHGYSMGGARGPGPSNGLDPHPLDPITVTEMGQVGRIVTQHNSSSPWQFKFIGLREPDKDLMLPYYESRITPPPGLIPRQANALICDPVLRHPIFVIVSLSEGKVQNWTEAKPGQMVAAVTGADTNKASNIALKEPEVAERLRKLGYGDHTKVVVDVWPATYVADNPNYAKASKIVQCYFYATEGLGDNRYAHPFDFVAFVELGPKARVRGVENLPIHQAYDSSNRLGNSVPTTSANYLSDFLPPTLIQRDLHPLLISQPQGPSFQVEGNSVTWHNFNFRMGYNPRKGFFLNSITYQDHDGKIRPIAYRLSIVEAYLSYGDPRSPYHRKSSYDMGNMEFGGHITSLPVHHLCRGSAHYLPSHHHNEAASTWLLQNSLCMVEEDPDVLWALYDSATGTTESVRNQRLSVHSLVDAGNRAYLITWRFHQDATIEFAIKVTGLLSTNLMALEVKAPPFGNLMMPQVYAQNYQHWFAVRMDMDVDGVKNSVSVEDIVRVSDTLSPENPFGNGITTRSTLLSTPAEAATDNRPHRIWKISNPGKVVNSLNGEPTSWKLIPDAPSPNLLTPDSPLIPSRVEWTEHEVWALPYHRHQFYAARQYLDGGVAQWTREAATANITNADVVLWHIFNYVHIPGVEDWPTMSSRDSIGFKLRPSNFFKQNPALYAPRAKEMTSWDEKEMPSVGSAFEHLALEVLSDS